MCFRGQGRVSGFSSYSGQYNKATNALSDCTIKNSTQNYDTKGRKLLRQYFLRNIHDRSSFYKTGHKTGDASPELEAESLGEVLDGLVVVVDEKRERPDLPAHAEAQRTFCQQTKMNSQLKSCTGSR